MAPIDLGLLLSSIVHLLATWPLAELRFYAHLERLDPRLRYLLPRPLPRYVRLEFHRLLKASALAWNPDRVLPGLGRSLYERGFDAIDLNTLGAALFSMLDELMEGRFSSEAREEWVRFYRALLPTLGGSPPAV